MMRLAGWLSQRGGGGMRIVTGAEGGWRTIRVVDADPGQRTALEELGFGPGLVRRYPAGTWYFDRAVANLRQGLEEMVRQSMTGTAPGWAAALGDLLDRAGQARVPLAVVGSVALAVRGIGVRPGDIDVITTVPPFPAERVPGLAVRGCRACPVVPLVTRAGAFPGLVVAGDDGPSCRL
jgi:hypothetical protein